MPESLTHLKKTEILRFLLEGIGLILLFGYFFYRSAFITVLLTPLLYPYLIYKGKEARKAEKPELLMQFKEMLVSVNGSLHAGYSIENAFIDSVKDLSQMYGEKAYIVKELKIIQRGLSNNIELSNLLKEFATRSEIDEINSFVGVLRMGKRSGGNLTRNMDAFVRVIEEKADVMQEIKTMTSARIFEQRIMNAVPFLIIFYVELTNKGFFSILYHNLFGNVVMTITMAIYILSIYLSKKLINIEI